MNPVLRKIGNIFGLGKYRDITSEDYLAPIRGYDPDTILEDWEWLVGSGVTSRLITSLGCVFYRKGEEIHFLDTLYGTTEHVADNNADFISNIYGTDEEFYKRYYPEVVLMLVRSGMALKKDQCYSPNNPPGLNGKFESSNFSTTSCVVHISFGGQLFEQTSKYPQGAKISDIKFEHADEGA